MDAHPNNSPGQDRSESPSRSPSPLPNPILTPIPTHPVDASPDTSSVAPNSWAPRASTPMGPYPMSPSKRAPTPLQEDDEQREGPEADDGDDHTPLGLGLDMPGEPQEARGSPSQPASTPKPALPAWRSIPGFEDLDESWAPANSVGPAADAASTSAVSAPSRSASASFFDAKQSMPTSRSRLAQTQAGPRSGAASDSEAQGGSVPPRSDSKGAATDTELDVRARKPPLLEPGPSRPEYRLSSLAIRRRQEHDDEDDAAHPPRSISPASTESGLKEGGSQARTSVQSNDMPSAQPSSDAVSPKFGTAQSGGTDVFAETAQEIQLGDDDDDGPEATFIALSTASDLPPVLQPAWKRGAQTPGGKGGARGRAWEAKSGGDIFSPLKLQSMFRTPTPEPRPAGDEASAAPEATPRLPANGEGRRISPPQREHFTFRASPSPGPSSAPAARPATPPAQQQLGRPHVGIPASASRPPPTPSGPHMPLRLFSFAGPAANGAPARSGPGLKSGHRGGMRDARGMMKPRPVMRGPALGEVASELPVESAQDREKKRLRVDVFARGTSSQLVPPLQSQPAAQPVRRDYVREAPDFMERIRNVRLASDERSTAGRGVSAIVSAEEDDGKGEQEGWVAEEEAGVPIETAPAVTAPAGPLGLRVPHLREGARNPTPATAVGGASSAAPEALAVSATRSRPPQSPLRISQRKVPSSSSSSGGSRASSSEPEAVVTGASASAGPSQERYVEGSRLISPLRNSRASQQPMLGSNFTESPRRFLRRWTAAAEVEYEVALEEEEAQRDALRQSVIVARRKRDEDLERRLEMEMREVEERMERRRREKEKAVRRDLEMERREDALAPAASPSQRRATDPAPSLSPLRRDSAASASSSDQAQQRPSILSHLDLPLAVLQRQRSSSSGLVNIAPTDMALDEMEKLGGGRMTFDRETMRWISRREAERRRAAAVGEEAGPESRRGTGSSGMSAIAESSREEMPVRRAPGGAKLGDVGQEAAASRLADEADASPLGLPARLGGAMTATRRGAPPAGGFEANLSAGSGDESSDPFKDIESFANSSGARHSPALRDGRVLVGTGAATLSQQQQQPPPAPPPVSRATQTAPVTLASKLTSAMPRSGSTLRNEIDLFSSEGDVSGSRTGTPSPSLTLHGAARTSPSTGRQANGVAPQAGASATASQAPRHAAATTPQILRTNAAGTSAPIAEPATPPPSSRSLAPGSAIGSARSLAQPPRSILKGSTSTLGGATPRPRAHPSASSLRPEPRSISFADPRDDSVSSSPGAGGRSPKGREKTERIAMLLRQLADVALGDEDDQGQDEELREGVEEEELAYEQEGGHPTWMQTPTRNGDGASTRWAAAPTFAGDQPPRSPWTYSVLHAKRRAAPLARQALASSSATLGIDAAEASFLTNASFNVAHDRILSLITDVAPWEPGWEELQSIDLSERRVESVLRLKEFLPSLRELRLDNNEIAYLSGLPATLTVLSVSRNRIPATVSFHHLLNLDTLDISHNEIESLTPLSCLVNLRHLRADANGLTSIEGIEKLTSLVSLSLRHNDIAVFDASQVSWPALETLNLSHNELSDVHDVWSLSRLRSLVLEHNDLDHVDLGARMSHLRVLRLSGNASLASLDVTSARRSLRTLYADFCALTDVVGLEECGKLENLSLRQQVGSVAPLAWPLPRLGPSIKRLFLSGNAFPSEALGVGSSQPRLLPSLVYLELSACQLTGIPATLLVQAPNLRHLNLDHNLLSELPPLQSLARLKRLTLVGCRLNRTRTLLEAVEGLQSLVVLDGRMNPCALGLYPPIILGPSPPAYPTSLSGAVPQALLAPLPNPAIVQPDAALRALSKARRQRRKEERMAEKSFFHRRRPGPDINQTLHDDEEDDEEDRTIRPSDLIQPSSPSKKRGFDAERERATTSSALFAISDARFKCTLPPDFARKRELHRASLAMACPALAWHDGLSVDEEEVWRMAEGGE